MNKQTSLRNRGSLLERAAEVYDFHGAMSGQPAAVPGAAPEAAEPAPNEETLDLGADQIIDGSAEAEIPVQAEPKPQARRSSRGGKVQPCKIDRDRLREGGFIVPEAATGALAEEFRIIKR